MIDTIRYAKSYITEPELKGGEWIFFYRKETGKPWFVFKNTDKVKVYSKYNAVLRKIYSIKQSNQHTR